MDDPQLTNSTLQDKAWMLRYLEGDLAAFEVLYRKYRPKVRCFT